MSGFRTNRRTRRAYPLRLHKGVVAIIHPTQLVPGTKKPAFAHPSGYGECDVKDCPRSDTHIHMGTNILNLPKVKFHRALGEVVRGGGVRAVMVEELAHTHQSHAITKKERERVEKMVRGIMPGEKDRTKLNRAKAIFLHLISPQEVEAKAIAKAVVAEEKK